MTGMADREKVIKGLKCRARCEQDGSCNGCEYFHPFSDDPDAGWCDSAELWKDALALLKEQEAHVLTLAEVKKLGADNQASLKNDGLTVMWLEEFGKQFPLHVVILKWDEDDWEGNDNDQTDVFYFGTDQFDHFALSQYGKTWRCWTDNPTETQREAVSWIA